MAVPYKMMGLKSSASPQQLIGRMNEMKNKNLQPASSGAMPMKRHRMKSSSMKCKTCGSYKHTSAEHGKKMKHMKSHKMKERPAKPQGRGIVKALHQKGTTGNFKRIEKAKGKGAAIGALQNKLAHIRHEPAPFGGKKKA